MALWCAMPLTVNKIKRILTTTIFHIITFSANFAMMVCNVLNARGIRITVMTEDSLSVLSHST